MNSRLLNATSRNDIAMAVRPEATYQRSTALDALNDATVARPAPVMPSGGIGPSPNMSTGTSTICSASAARYTTARTAA